LIVVADLLAKLLHLLCQFTDILGELLNALPVVHLAMEAHLHDVDPFGLELLYLK
jgi:hypothetical protein